MKKTDCTRITASVVLAVLLVSSSSVVFFPPQEAIALIADKKEITIASWNTFDFGGKFGGASKSIDPTILQAMTDVIRQYDIIFIQEIANHTAPYNAENPFSGFNTLCSQNYLGMHNYLCKNTGKIDSQEGYGIIYKNNIGLSEVDVINTSDILSLNPHIVKGSSNFQMKRPPMKTTLGFGDSVYNVIVYNVHTSPSGGVSKEINLLSKKISETHNLLNMHNVIVLGDLNADGKRRITPNKLDGGTDYYRDGFTAHLNHFSTPNWQQTITDTAVTNFANTHRAYDRIILSNAASHSYQYSGIVGAISNVLNYSGGSYAVGTLFKDVHIGGGQTGKALSDHRLVWAQFNRGGIQSTNNVGNLEHSFNDFVNEPTCDEKDAIYAKGEGFVSNKQMRIYLTDLSQNYNRMGNFKNIGAAYLLHDISVDGYKQITTDYLGNIINTHLWTEPVPDRFYNVIVDVNRDGYFTNSIDVIDVIDTSGLEVKKCNKKDSSTDKLSIKIKEGVRKRLYQTSFDEINTYLKGQNTSGGDKSMKVFGVNADITKNLATDTIVNLSANSTFSKEVIITEQGEFEKTVTWNTPIPGIYNIIVDVNNNDVYEPGIDVVDYTDEIGFIVLDDDTSYNDVTHIAGVGIEHEVYNTKVTQNIYTLAQNLPASQDVDVYVISQRLLEIKNPEWITWEDATTNPTLLDIAVPVYPFGAKVDTIQTASDGTFFVSTWKNPDQIFDSSFINYYGKKYNVVIDVNQDGIYDKAIDKVDTHNISAMKEWFETHDILDESANGNTAITQYKEYLNDKLFEQEFQLNPDNTTYNAQVTQESNNYLCSDYLTKDKFQIIEAGSQVGFRVIDLDEYHSDKELDDGRYMYHDVEFGGKTSIKDNSASVIISRDGQISAKDIVVGKNSTLDVCHADKVDVEDIVVEEKSHLKLKAKNTHIKGDTKVEDGSTMCVRAGVATNIFTGLFAIGAAPFTGGASLAVGLGVITANTIYTGTQCVN